MAQCSVIVKVTRLCNLRCTYCHDWRSGPGQTMSFSVLARVLKKALEDERHDQVTFVWHGGEPTVLPLRWFERALAVQARYARPWQQVRNVVQTNGTRITDEWARFLRDHEFSVGVSIDGPAEVHDRTRLKVDGQGSFDDVVEGLRVLREHGVKVGVLMVADRPVLDAGPDAVFDFMLERGIRSYGFNAVCPDNQPDALPVTPATPYATPGEMGRFLAGLYDRWLSHGDTDIRIRELDGIVSRLRGDEAVPCQLRGGCLGEYFIVEPDGEVAHCDLFLGDPAYRLGNVLTHSFEELRSAPAAMALREERAEELARMAACPEFEVCNGWCPHETYLSRRHDPAHTGGCCGLGGLIRHVRAAGLPEPRPPERAREPVLLPTPEMRSAS